MKFKQWAAAALAVFLIMGCFAGCDTRGNPEESMVAGPTGPGSQKWNTGQLEETLTEYSHCGLHILLDSSYTADTSDQSFTFANGKIRGGIEFGPEPVCDDGRSVASPEYMAVYLKEKLGGMYAVEVGKTANGITYAEIRGEHFYMIRSLFLSRGKSWNLWLRSDPGESLKEQMLQVVSNATLVTVEAPTLPEDTQTVEEKKVIECSGLFLPADGQSVKVNKRQYSTEFTVGRITGEIQRKTLVVVPTVEELVQNATGVSLSAWDHVERSTDGEIEKLVVYNDKYTDDGFYGTVHAFYVRRNLCWEIEAKGDDLEAVLKFVSSGRLDDFGYYRHKFYDYQEYGSFSAILQELEAAGYEDWGQYSLTINGLASPVVFEMIGAKVERITAFGRTKEVTGMVLSGDDGIFYAQMGQDTEAIWLNVVSGTLSNSQTWVFSKKMNVQYAPEDSMGVILYPSANGGVFFRRYGTRYANAMGEEGFDPLKWAVSRDEVCYDQGRVDIRFGELNLITDAGVTVAEIYDVDALFAAAKKEGRFPEYSTPEELLESNVVRYPA